jgi:hypothetical protein
MAGKCKQITIPVTRLKAELSTWPRHDEFRQVPWRLIEDAQRALQTFDEALDWSAIWQVNDEEDEDTEDELEESIEEAEADDTRSNQAADDRPACVRKDLLFAPESEQNTADRIELSRRGGVMRLDLTDGPSKEGRRPADQIEAPEKDTDAGDEETEASHNEFERTNALSWEDVEGSVKLAFDIWTDQRKLAWAKQAFDLLVSAGLAEDTDAFSRHQGIFRVMVLGGIYRDFCEAAWDQTSWINYVEWCEPPEIVDQFVIGQLFAWMPDWDADEDVEFSVALDRLVEAERGVVVEALLKGFGGVAGLYASLWHSAHDRDDVEAFESEDCFEPDDAGKLKAYEWVSEGCSRLADLTE